MRAEMGILLACCLSFGLNAREPLIQGNAPIKVVVSIGQFPPVGVAYRDSDNVVRTRDEFVVDTTITNMSGATQTIVEICDNARSWLSDNPALSISTRNVLKCGLVEKRLGPGEQLHEKVRVLVARSARKPLTFRLGFEPAAFGEGSVDSALRNLTVWSNPLTLAH